MTREEKIKKTHTELIRAACNYGCVAGLQNARIDFITVAGCSHRLKTASIAYFEAVCSWDEKEAE